MSPEELEAEVVVLRSKDFLRVRQAEFCNCLCGLNPLNAGRLR